jgi:hypothetical protein
MVGKAALLLAVAGVSGYYYHREVLANNARASSLTLLEYTADFDKYKAGLIQAEWPLWGHIVLFVFMVGAFFGLYEGLGWASAWAIGRLLPSSASDPPRPPNERLS